MAATETTASVPTSTNTYRTVVVTSFPFNPLTTQFAQPTYCDAVYYGDIYMVDPQNECLPTSHNKQETAYYSPGYVCPKGYLTAKIDNKGVHSITTVTCCPYRSDIILSAVDPATLAGQWVNLFCTWIAPEATRIDIVHTENGRTWTEQAPVTSPGGVNAYGVRMVYQSSDLEAATATASGTGATSATAASTVSPTGTGPVITSTSTATAAPGLSTGAAVAIAAVVPLVAVGMLAGIGFWWWKRRQTQKYNHVNGAGTPHGSPSNQGSTFNQASHVHEVPNAQHSYPDQQQYYQHQQHSPVHAMHSMQSLPSTYQTSTAAPSVHQQPVPYAQQYGHGGGYTSYTGYKPPGLSEEGALPAAEQAPTPTSELAAAIPLELPDDPNNGQRTARGLHIDHQKVMGMGPLR
ncbi:hypothetical protein EsH8_III_001455 [Colletotrichum jinshuiense]